MATILINPIATFTANGKTINPSDFASFSTAGMTGNITIQSALEHAYAATGHSAGTYPSSGTPTRSGYTFNGYIVTVGGIADAASTNMNKVVCSASATGNVTIMFSWKQATTSSGTTGTLTYNLSTAGIVGTPSRNGVPTTQTYTVGQPFYLSSSEPVLAGYEFGGWSYGGVTYQKGASITINSASATLNAIWGGSEVGGTVSGKTKLFYDFNGKNATWSYSSRYQEYTVGQAFRIYTEVPKVSGWKFVSWYSLEKGQNFNPGDWITLQNKEAMLQANWMQDTISTYLLTYSAPAGCTNVPSPASYASGTYISVPMNITRPSETVGTTIYTYRFKGWHDQADSDTSSLITSGLTMPSRNVTLVAVWDTTTSSTGGSSGGGGEVDPPVVNPDPVNPTPTPTPTPSSPDPEYSVTYFGSGCTYVPYDSNTYKSGATVRVLGNPTRPNDDNEYSTTIYTFTGWKSSADGSVYQPGSTFTMPNIPVRMTAQFSTNSSNKPQDRRVRYIADMCTNIPPEEDHKAGERVTVANAPTRSDAESATGTYRYVFKGWKYSETMGILQPGQTFVMPDKGVTLTAQFESTFVPNTYILTYSADGGTLAAGSTQKSVTAGKQVNLANAPTKSTSSGYWRFDGWGYGGAVYDAGALFTMPNNDVTMTAKWTFVPANALGTPTWQMTKFTYETGTTAQLKWTNVQGASYYMLTTPDGEKGPIRPVSNVAPTVTYNWTQKTDGTPSFLVQAFSTDTAHYVSQSAMSLPLKLEFVTPEPDITYYRITYNANGGTGAPPAEDQPEGRVVLSAQQPSKSTTKRKYEFLGWSTNASATVAEYKAGAVFYLMANVTLYAVWREVKEPVTITFEPNGGTVVPATKAFLKNWPYNSAENSSPSFPTPSRSPIGEYVFVGWFTTATGGSQVTTDQECTGARTLYAHWTRNAPGAPVWYTSNPTFGKRGSMIPLTWRSVTSAAGYEIRIGGSGWIRVDGTTFNFSVPADFTGSYAEVRSFNSDGQYSDISVPLQILLDKGSAPPSPAECYINRYKDPPTIFTNDFNNPEYDVSWSRVIDPDFDLKGYYIYAAYNGSDSWQLIKVTDAQTTSAKFPCAELEGYTSIQVEVVAFDDVGNVSPPTKSNSVTISAKRPPSTPTNVTAPDQEHLPPEIRDGIIHALEEFRVSWKGSLDPDGDLVGYTIQESRDGEDWANTRTISATEPTYIYAVLPRSVKQVRYRVQAFDALGLASEWGYSTIKDVSSNVAPTQPGEFNIPNPVKGGEYFMIAWGPSSDEDFNLRGYIIERILDGNEWTEIGNVDTNQFIDYVPKSAKEQHATVAYRVRAYDAAGAMSAWRTSNTVNVSNNSTPKITSDFVNGEYLGVFEHGFTIPIHVTDEEKDDVDITFSLCPVGSSLEEGTEVLQTITGAKTSPDGYDMYFTLSEDVFTALPMTRFILMVTATDSEGTGQLILEFARRNTQAMVTLKDPMKYPEHIVEIQFSTIEGSFPTDCIRKMEVTNNANDRPGAVRWEDCTTEALAGDPYQFKNKMVYSPAFNYRFVVNRGPSGASGFITHIAGCFKTISDVEVEF